MNNQDITVTELLNHHAITTLLDAQQEHRSIKIFLNSRQAPRMSAVLGFDYFGQQLLLDGFLPQVEEKVKKAMHKQPFWAQLRADRGVLNICCVLIETTCDLHTVKIIHCEHSDNRRWHTRIHFRPRSGPDITFDVPRDLPLQGAIRNLSVHGALVEFYGDDVRDRLIERRRYNGRLRFNEHFDLEINCQLRKVNFNRKPACHGAVRLMFEHSSEVALVQLENFIEAFHAGYDIAPVSALQRNYAISVA